MSAAVGDVVIPGETFKEAEDAAGENKKIVLGDGLRYKIETEIFKTALKNYIFKMQHFKLGRCSSCDKKRKALQEK